MAGTDSVKDARDQLNLVLSFFPRVDAKLSTVLAVDTAILATIASAVPPIHQLTIAAGTAALTTTLLLACSFISLYRGGFPNTEGGHSSLVYFRDIAARNEARFLEDFANQTGEALRADILAQVWRNSAILTAKYKQLKLAFVFMACALLPWAVSLATFSLAKQGLHIIVKQ